MTAITYRKRDKLPDKVFAEPGKRAYPITDRSHAANAKARASEMVNKGKMSKSTESKSTESKIDAKADKKLYGAGKPPMDRK